MSNKIVWFDLPVVDLPRAILFYKSVLEVEIKEEFPGVAVISHKDEEISGCLYLSSDYKPSKDGALLYFNVNGRLENAVAAAGKLGGRTEQSQHEIGSFGRRAIVIDSEGNRIALHSE